MCRDQEINRRPGTIRIRSGSLSQKRYRIQTTLTVYYLFATVYQVCICIYQVCICINVISTQTEIFENKVVSRAQFGVRLAEQFLLITNDPANFVSPIQGGKKQSTLNP